MWKELDTAYGLKSMQIPRSTSPVGCTPASSASSIVMGVQMAAVVEEKKNGSGKDDQDTQRDAALGLGSR